MHWNNFSLRKKLVFSFGGGLLLMVVFALVALGLIRSITDEADLALAKHEFALTLTLREVDHLRWAEVVGDFVANHDPSRVALNVQTDGTKCVFGVWFYGDGRAELEKLVPAARTYFDALEAPHLAMHKSALHVEELVKQGDESAALAAYEQETRIMSEQVAELLSQIRNVVAAEANQDAASYRSLADAAPQCMAFLLLVAVVGSLGAGYVIYRSLARPVHGLAAKAKAVAEGNLDIELNLERRDEVGQLAQALNSMVASLKAKLLESETKSAEAKANAAAAQSALAESEAKERRISVMLDTMADISTRADDIARRLAELSGSLADRVEDVARGSEEQYDHVASNAAAVSELASTAESIAGNARDTAGGAERTKEQAAGGVDVVRRCGEAITRVAELAGQHFQDIQELGRMADSITGIMSVISDIADQTNLLALNAAIEAARAGEAGKGFAVVADEVRKLADKTMKATEDVGRKISSIQESIHTSVMFMEQAKDATMSANDLALESGATLRQILDLAEANTDNVHGIATAAQQQTATVEDMARSMQAVRDIASHTNEGMREAAGLVRSVAERAEDLQGLIEQLRHQD